jgi:AcrR family transcriptional regulator
MARTGRRPGRESTRIAITDAARAAFTQEGYDAATIRDIARRAGVDPALVHHFFGTKRQLFVETMQLPFDPESLIEMLLSGGRETIGERMAHTFFTVWESSDAVPIIALVRSAASHEDAARMLREVVAAEIIGRIAEELGTPDARLRASLVGSQVVGLVMARYIIRIEPLASADPDVLMPALAGTLQRYLTGDISTHVT